MTSSLCSPLHYEGLSSALLVWQTKCSSVFCWRTCTIGSYNSENVKLVTLITYSKELWEFGYRHLLSGRSPILAKVKLTWPNVGCGPHPGLKMLWVFRSNPGVRINSLVRSELWLRLMLNRQVRCTRTAWKIWPMLRMCCGTEWLI